MATVCPYYTLPYSSNTTANLNSLSAESYNAFKLTTLWERSTLRRPILFQLLLLAQSLLDKPLQCIGFFLHEAHICNVELQAK